MKNTFEIKAWDEKNYLEISDQLKYSKASVSKTYDGLLKGNGQLEYIMSYFVADQASFVGIEHFDGVIDGRQGTLSFEHKGTFINGVVNSEFTVIDGSGTQELEGLNAKGRFSSGHSMTVDFEFDLLG